MDGEQGNKGVVELAQVTLQASTEYLNTLKTHTEKLEAKLETLDKLIDAADAIDESDMDVGSSATVPGSVRAIAPVTTRELLLPESPFHKDALKRSRYQSLSEVHPMKTKELEILTEAVRAECYRKYALDVQKRGCSAFPDIDVRTTPILGMSTEGIDWERIAEKVSAISMATRSARECEIRWLGEHCPEFNHDPWGAEEELKVKSLAAEYTNNHPDWLTIAEKLGTRRTPLDCMRHAITRKPHRWTVEADQRLLKAIHTYGNDNWHLVARYVSEDVTPSQCSNRFQKTLDDSIERTAWSPEEDARLSAAVAAYGSSWVDVAANIPGRHNDQCRERWTEQLDPNINKSPWSEEEDRVLLDYVCEHKDTSWKKISEYLRNGRTEDMCRNRYAVLQRGASTVSATPAVNPQVQVASIDQPVETPDNTLQFKLTFPDTPIPLQAGHRHPNQFVFLEPVVSSSPELDKHHRPPSSQHITRFKMATSGSIPSSDSTTTPPLKKKRKTRTRSEKPSTQAQQVPTG